MRSDLLALRSTAMLGALSWYRSSHVRSAKAGQRRSSRALVRAQLCSSTDLSATPLSGDPPPLGPRRSWPPVAPSDGRRGFSTVPSLLRVARACSAAPIAGSRPSADKSLVLVRRSSHYSTCCTSTPENADLCASWSLS